MDPPTRLSPFVKTNLVPKQDPRLPTLLQLQSLSFGHSPHQSEPQPCLLSTTQARIFSPPSTLLPSILSGKIFSKVHSVAAHTPLSDDGANEKYHLHIVRVNGTLLETYLRVTRESFSGREVVRYESVLPPPSAAVAKGAQIKKEALGGRAKMAEQVKLEFEFVIEEGFGATSMLTCTAWTPLDSENSDDVGTTIRRGLTTAVGTGLTKMQTTILPSALTTARETEPQSSLRTQERGRSGTRKGQNQNTLTNGQQAFRLLNGVIDAVRVMFQKHRHKGRLVDDLDDERFLGELEGAPPPTDAESTLVHGSLKLVEMDGWKTLPGYAMEITSMYKRLKIDGSNVQVLGKVVTVVDLKADKVFARIWNMNSNDFVENSLIQNGKLARSSYVVPKSHSAVSQQIISFPGLTKCRWFESWHVWKLVQYRSRRAIVVALCPIDDYDGTMTPSRCRSSDFQQLLDDTIRTESQSLVKGQSRAAFIIRELAPDICELTYIVSADLGGHIPLKIIEWKIPNQLKWVSSFQENHQRKNKMVDIELRKAMALQMKASSAFQQRNLSEEQRTLLTSCQGLKIFTPTSSRDSLRFFDSRKGTKGWQSVDSKDSLVQLSLRSKSHLDYAHTKKAEALLDCSAEEAAFYWFHCGSREARQRNKETGATVIPMVQYLAENDIISAEILRMSFPLTKREFITRRLITADSRNESWLVAVLSVKKHVDYGETIKAARGSAKVFVECQRVGDNQCQLTIYQQIDGGGSAMNSKIANSQLDLAFYSSIYMMRKAFARDREIDAEQRRTFKPFFGERNHDVTADEADFLLKYGFTFNKYIRSKKWKNQSELQQDHFIEYSTLSKKIEDETCFLDRVTFTIDADIKECVAWELSKKSRDQLNYHLESRISEWEFRQVNPSSFYYSLATPIGFAEFEEAYSIVIDWDGKPSSKSIGVVYAPPAVGREEQSTYLGSRRGSMTIGKMAAAMFGGSARLPSARTPQTTLRWRAQLASENIVHWKYEALPQVRDVKQTRVTLLLQLKNRGYELLRKPFIGMKLSYVSRMRRYFDRSREIDGTVFEETKRILSSQEQSYTTQEEITLQQGQNNFSIFENNGIVKKVQCENRTITGEIVLEGGDSAAWNRSQVLVRANTEDVLAYLWNFDAKCRWTKADLDREVVENVSAHNQTRYHCIRVLLGGKMQYKPREYTSTAIWKKIDEGTFLIVTMPIAVVRSKPFRVDRIRAEVCSVNRLQQISHGLCRVVNLTRREFGGNSTKWLQKYSAKFSMSRMSSMQRYFQGIRRLEDWDAEDGKVVAEFMLIRAEVETKRGATQSEVDTRIKSLFEDFYGLRTWKGTHEFAEVMMAKVIECKLRPANDMRKKSTILSLKDGQMIGGAFAGILATNTAPDSAVDEWVSRYPALKEMDTEFVWFRPMMSILGKRLLSQASFGLKLRVTVGAALSLADLITDVVMIANFFGHDGKKIYAAILSVFRAASIFFQLAITSLQYKGKNPKIVVQQYILVVLGLKHVVDAMRVASGNSKGDDRKIDPLHELTLTQCTKLVLESVPGSIIQIKSALDTIIARDYLDIVSFGSILVSVFTSAFTSATLSFDYDTDPERRKESPHFYGYIADKPRIRSFMFLLLILSNSCCLAAKGTTAGLLIIINPMIFVFYFVSDMAIYILQKLLRNDFMYWVPLESTFAYVISSMNRILIKLAAEYTCIVQFRHPHELGGFYWFATIIMTFIVMFASIALFESEQVNFKATEDEMLDTKPFWALAIGLTSCWIVAISLLLLLMEPKYRRTFTSTQTGRNFGQMYFKEGQSDAEKCLIFTHNVKLWKEDIGEEVKSWVQERWKVWTVESPGWFTDDVRTRIPLEYIPTKTHKSEEKKRRESTSHSSSLRSSVVIALSATGEQQKRRSSMAAILPLVAGSG